MRKIVHIIKDTCTFLELWEVMNFISHLDPSFHPVPQEGVVNIKVDAAHEVEARELLNMGDKK